SSIYMSSLHDALPICYAWGDDYHEIVAGKLRELLSWINEQWPDTEGKVCVDIQPVMDKAWAARAGLGWIGKHTNLITPEFGSWVDRKSTRLNSSHGSI